MKTLRFYHINERQKHMPFSEDLFMLSLEEIIEGCVQNVETFIQSFMQRFGHLEDFFDCGISTLRSNNGNTMDYLVTVGVANHILISLLEKALDEEKENIYAALELIDESIAPRPGQNIVKTSENR